MIANNSQSDNLRLIDVKNLALELANFAEARNWTQFHTPKNLVMALTGEVGELNELFQWMTEEQSADAGKNVDTTVKVEQELADVLLYLVRLSDVLGIDLNEAAIKKLQHNAEKYPIVLSYGSSKKYDQL